MTSTIYDQADETRKLMIVVLQCCGTPARDRQMDGRSGRMDVF